MVILALLLSCTGKNTEIDLGSNQWVCLKMKKRTMASYKKAPKPYTLTFINDTTYTLLLDVNACQGYYHILNPGHIDIERMGCTEVCCDLEFAGNLSEVFAKMTRYYTRGDQLVFSGPGSIVFKAK